MMASSETFKPGLFGIGLNIEKKLSNNALFVVSQQLKFHLKNKPSYMIPAICNLQAVLSFHMDSGRTDAREILEKLIMEYPNDLNVIADLIYLNKKMGRERDSHRYKDQLKSNMNDQLLQARSILAQAYALNYDLTHEHDKTPKVLLKDACRLLKIEDKHTQQVDRAINLVTDAYKMVNTIPQTAYEKTIDAKEIAIKKFEKGIKILEKLNCSKEEIFVWKHNLANARGKLENWRTKRDDDFDECRFENCRKALETHLDVIENLSPIEHLEENVKIFIARSYIFFVQLYQSRKYYIERNTNPSERIRIQNMDSMYHKALSMCPNDKTILQRGGRYQLNKKEYLEAVKLFDKSIQLLPDIYTNWFSYASRSEAYYSYSRKLIEKKSDDHEINKYLVLAYEDAKRCLQSKRTEICMMRMAQICFLRAMPDTEPGVSFGCQQIQFIYEALETLHETFDKREITKHGKIYSHLGRYYPYIGEYRKAIESLKTSLELNNWSKNFPNSFNDLCKCFVAFYKREKDKNLLSEFRFMLKEAKRRHCDKWVSDAMNIMRQHDPEMLTDLVQNMIEWDARGCDMLIDEGLYKSFFKDRPESIRICQNLGEEFETKFQARNDEKSDINGPMEIQRSQSAENFQYDFFISHSEDEKDWVNSILRPRLEEFDDEIKFRGFIPSRDFIPGEHVIDSMIKGIKQSCKLLIVLTPNYLDDNWQKFVSDTMIFSVIETKVEEKTIIPIILEECNIPDKLKIFTPIYFTKESNWERLRRSLCINLDAETGLEERMSALTTCDIDED